jgi:hypothetical protein
MMKTTNILKIVACLLIGLLLFQIAWAEAPEAAGKVEKENEEAATETTQARATPPMEGLAAAHFFGAHLSLGAQYSNLEGSQVKVSEFTGIDQGIMAVGQFGIWGNSENLSYDISGNRGVQSSDQGLWLDSNLARHWRSELRISKMPHRLVRDPLTNLDTAKGPVVVRHTVEDDEINYCPVYQDLSWENNIRVPHAPFLTVNVGYRNQTRTGSYQGRTMSKCANCHVVSKVRLMDQETEQLTVGFEISSSKASLTYQYMDRSFSERAAAPMNIYDEVQHPKFTTRVFTNRAQFEIFDGPLPFLESPDFEKRQHSLRGRVELPSDAGQITGTYLSSTDTNLSMSYGIESQVLSGRYAAYLGEMFALTVQARNLDIDTDSIAVDVIERVADFGPQKGKTYPEIYTDFGVADWVSQSSLAREQFDFLVNGRVLLPGKTVFRAGYEFENLEREHSEAEQSKTNTFKLSLNSSPSRKFKGRASYTYAHTDTPFTHVKAALPPALQLSPSPPGPPSPSPLKGTQYFTIYGARQADLSNYPRNAQEFTGSVTWSPADNFALNGHFRWKDHKNDELNSFSDWQNTAVSPSVDLWFAPDEKVDILASYSYNKRKTDSLFGIAVYDG